MLNVHLFGYHFKPSWIPTIATALLLPLLISLGCWQLQRAEYKRGLQDKFKTRTSMTPLQLTEAKDNWAALDYYPIKVTGHYDNQHNILLDNKIQNHQVGFQVITPFIATNNNQENTIILVNRGWIPRKEIRTQLPILTPVTGEQTLTGMLHIPPKRSFSLGQNYSTQISWPLVMQTINLAEAARLLNQPLQPFMLLLAPGNPHGFIRDWQPTTPVSPEKHWGYAFQWFALALTLLLIYIGVNSKRKPNHEE